MASSFSILSIVLLPFAVAWALPLVSDLIAVAKLLAGSNPRQYSKGSVGHQRLLVLVPAHNEAGQIGRCVRSILEMQPVEGAVQLIVIADNCTDDTAGAARKEGAEVWERSEMHALGKPRAIQWALQRVSLPEVDAVLIIDADAQVAPDYAEQVVRSGRLRDRAIQTYNALENEEQSWASLLGGLLVRSKYEGQYELRAFSGLNAPLTGNGMCIGGGVLERCGWAADALTENWELYARYTVAGERIDLVTAARVESLEPATVGASSVRRSRWQAGKWAVIQEYFWRILSSHRIGFHQKTDLLAELVSPGPVVHGGIGFGLGLVLIWFASSWSLLSVGFLFLLSPLPSVFWTVRAVVRHPHPGKVTSAMARLPFYFLWRVLIIGRALPTLTRGVWKRSPRPGDA